MARPLPPPPLLVREENSLENTMRRIQKKIRNLGTRHRVALYISIYSINLWTQGYISDLFIFRIAQFQPKAIVPLFWDTLYISQFAAYMDSLVPVFYKIMLKVRRRGRRR